MALPNFDPTSPNFSTSSDHGKLRNILTFLNYESNERGICYGFACMGLQAFLGKDINTFKERLAQIKSLPITLYISLPILIKRATEKAREEALKATTDHSIVNMSDFNLLSDSQKAIFAKKFDASLIEHLALLVKKNYDISLTFEETEILFSTIPFAEGIELNQQPHSPKYVNWFEQPVLTQDIVRSMPLTQSSQLEALGGIAVVDHAISCYSKVGLETLLESFVTDFKSQHRVGFLLKNINHEITVGYDPESKKWTFIDFKDLTVLELNSIKEITDQIIAAYRNDDMIDDNFTFNCDNSNTELITSSKQAFPKTEVASFSTTIICCKNHFNEIKTEVEHWKNSSAWNRVHNVNGKSPAELNMIDSNNQSQLLMAARCDDYRMMSDLIHNGADINQANIEGTTALHYAVIFGTTKSMELLLKNNIHVDVMDEDGVSPLQDAIEQKDFRKVRLLLIYGADPTLYDKKIIDKLTGHRSEKIMALLAGAKMVYDEITNLTKAQPIIFSRLLCIRKFYTQYLDKRDDDLFRKQLLYLYQLDKLLSKESDLSFTTHIYADFFKIEAQVIPAFLFHLEQRFTKTAKGTLTLFQDTKPSAAQEDPNRSAAAQTVNDSPAKKLKIE